MIKTTLFALLFTLLYVLMNGEVFARGLFQITNRTGTCSTTTICDVLENDINTSLPDADASNYLKAMGNSNVTAQKGLGVDYASNFDFFVVGYGIGLGADLGGSSASDAIDGDVDSDKVKGFGASAAFMAGLNLWFVGLKNINVYGHFMNTNISSYINDVKGDVSSFGFHVQAQLMEDTGISYLAKWGGLDFTTGLVLGSMKLKMTKTLNKSYTSGADTATFNGTINVGADVDTWSIPFEISSNVQLLYILSIYGGLGLDISGGTSKGITEVTGPITFSGGAGSGTGELNVGQKESPTTFQLRNFLGVQLNLAMLKVWVQMNDSMTNDTFGVAAGVRVAF